MKLFRVPINHPFIQGLTEFDLDFIEWSSAYDNPKFKERMENTVYDDSFEDFWEGKSDVHGNSTQSTSEDDLVPVEHSVPEVLSTFKKFIPTDFLSRIDKQPIENIDSPQDYPFDDEFQLIERAEDGDNSNNDWEVVK